MFSLCTEHESMMTRMSNRIADVEVHVHEILMTTRAAQSLCRYVYIDKLTEPRVSADMSAIPQELFACLHTPHMTCMLLIAGISAL